MYAALVLFWVLQGNKIQKKNNDEHVSIVSNQDQFVVFIFLQPFSPVLEFFQTSLRSQGFDFFILLVKVSVPLGQMVVEGGLFCDVRSRHNILFELKASSSRSKATNCSDLQSISSTFQKQFFKQITIFQKKI